MAQAVNRRTLVEARVRSQVTLFEIYGGRSGTATGFSPSALILFYQQYAALTSRITEIKLCTFKQQKAFAYLRALVKNVVPCVFSQRHRDIILSYLHR
jgi:hypothetical protein